jgi:hypothetical protein
VTAFSAAEAIMTVWPEPNQRQNFGNIVQDMENRRLLHRIYTTRKNRV